LIRKAITASAVVSTVAAFAFLSGGAGAASKKTYKVDMRAKGGTISGGGTVIKGVKATGTPFGKCSIDVVYDPPQATQTWKCKGGGFKGVYTATINGDTVTGKPKLSKGTGKFKGISGTLNLKGSISKSDVKMTGKARY
jgi:hypothetical protein